MRTQNDTFSMLTFLIFGDVVGKIGREALMKALPGLKRQHKPDLTILNAENLAHGKGVTAKILSELRDAGVDFFTSGNHIYNNMKGATEAWADPELKDRLVRPANFPPGMPGDGWKTLEVGGKKVLVVNLICQVFMDKEYANPFEAIDRILGGLDEPVDAILVDLHGEATSERIAFGFHVDGRFSSVTGTHTHVPTADARILSKGTAYLTDIGMTGARFSVLGVSPEGPLSRFTAGEAKPFEIPEAGPVDLNAVVVKVDPNTRKAVSIEQIHQVIE